MSQPPAKRVKFDDSSKPVSKFTSAEEIRASLKTQDPHQLTEGLNTLRNQFTVKFGEFAISPQDERLLLAQQWLEAVPHAHEIFDLLENANQRQTSLVAALVSVLSALLTLLSSHYIFQPLGQPILKLLLSPPWMRRLNTYIGGSHTELILVTLKLFNSMSAFANGKERKTLLELFAWEIKYLPKLLYMRRKTKTGNATDSLAKPDIRTLYVVFILSFVETDNPASIKAEFLEQHRDVFLSIFKGLFQDSYAVVRKVLKVCWAGIWSDLKLKRTLKISLFNELTLSHIIKIYDRVASEGTEPHSIPADLVHHFLLALCTRPSKGICFKDRGWYPRESEIDDLAVQDEQESKSSRGGKAHNKILANILKRLKVNEDPRQQELALKIMAACPELVAGYWTGAALTLEPRLSSKWITNISLFGAIIALPVPSASFLLFNSSLYDPTPPPLTNILGNIFPPVNIKTHLSRGLQSASPLVQHCTALALIKCLIKYENVMHIFQEVARTLEEDEDDGQWSKRRKEIAMEVRRRAPDFQVIVAFCQQKFNDGTPVSQSSLSKVSAIRDALLSESAQRLLWLYRRGLPSVVAEVRFDLGKLLQSFSDTQAKVMGESSERIERVDAPSRLHAIRQLHILRLLKESDQFVWSGKPPSSTRSYLHVLLKSYVVSDHYAKRLVLKALLCSILSASVMFQEDAEEPCLWLASLPKTRRAIGTKSPDGAPLTDEGDSVLAFLDDCVQRCLKTPYRYVDDMNAMWTPESENVPEGSSLPIERYHSYPSPLLMTVLEQVAAKVAAGLFSPSDILAITSFIRKLVFRLLTKQQDPKFLRAFTDKLDGGLQLDQLALSYPVVTAAIRREVSIIRYCLGDTRDIPFSQPNSANRASLAFLDHIEGQSLSEGNHIKITSAFQVVDWLRLVDFSLSPEELRRLVTVVERCHKPATKDLCESLHPAQGLLWDGLNILSRYSQLRDELSFEWLFVQSGSIDDAARRNVLVEVLFVKPISQIDIKRALCLVIHHLVFSKDQDVYLNNLFLLLGSIMKKAQSFLPLTDVDALKEYLFLQSSFLTGVASSDGLSDTTFEGFAWFIEISLDPTRPDDRKFASYISAHWLDVLRRNLESGLGIQIPFIKLWVKYFEPDDLFGLVYFIGERINVSNPVIVEFLTMIINALRLSTSSGPRHEAALQTRLKGLITVRSLLKQDPALENMIAAAVNANLPFGHTGLSFDSLEYGRLISLSLRADTCWSHRLAATVDDDQMHSFLSQESWSPSSVQIISGMLYRQPFSRSTFCRWLSTENCTNRSTSDLARIVHAFLDLSRVKGDEVTDLDGQNWMVLFSRLLASTVDPANGEDLRALCASCICLMVTLMQSKRSEFLTTLESNVRQLPVGILTPQILTVANRLHPLLQTGEFVPNLMNRGLQWAVRYLSCGDVSTEDAQTIFEELIALASCNSDITPHLVDTVLTAAIKDHLSDPTVLALLNTLVKATPLKPLIVNRHLQSILQHPKFFKLCDNSELGNAATKDSIVHLVYILFNFYPSNTCHPTHLDPLVRIYGGSASTPDRELLSIFQLFEHQRKTSVASLITRWSPPNMSASNALHAILNLDSAQVLRTCIVFPKWRCFSNFVSERKNALDAQVYDPVFLVLLFARMLSESPPTSAFTWVQLFRTHVTCLLIRCLSSKDGPIREMALRQIVDLWSHLETADMQEKPQVIYIFNMLKNTFPQPSAEFPIRLPSYSSLILLHALRGIFYPSSFTYPLTAHFLLQRPVLDTNDVPMLYAMLYSSSDEWKKERGWIVRFLSDGMMASEDWVILKRRHTWDLLASFFQSSEKDHNLRKAILEVLANLTCNFQATMSLALKSGLLTWIEMQLLGTIAKDEDLAWLKILQNIVIIADHSRLQSVTNGESRAVICRCLGLLLDYYASSTVSPLGLTAQIILQLSLLPGPATAHLPSLVTKAADHLKRFEKSTDINVLSRKGSRQGSLLVSLHAAHGLHDHPMLDDPLQLWGEWVEALWRATMTFENKHPAWDALTCRLLLWRAIIGEGSIVGEWARKEVVRNLCGQVQ